jgi:hypothetical protein
LLLFQKENRGFNEPRGLLQTLKKKIFLASIVYGPRRQNNPALAEESKSGRDSASSSTAFPPARPSYISLDNPAPRSTDNSRIVVGFIQGNTTRHADTSAFSGGLSKTEVCGGRTLISSLLLLLLH